MAAKQKKLTDKQQRFVEEYTVDMNATQAAIRAGYSEKTAGATGNENLKKPEIKKAIAEAKQKTGEEINLTKEMIINGLLEIAQKPDARESARVKAWELLGKYKGLFDEKLNVQHAGGLSIELVEYKKPGKKK